MLSVDILFNNLLQCILKFTEINFYVSSNDIIFYHIFTVTRLQSLILFVGFLERRKILKIKINNAIILKIVNILVTVYPSKTRPK